MSQTKLYHTIKEKLFTDLVLTLIDNNNQLTINVHKIILYATNYMLSCKSDMSMCLKLLLLKSMSLN